MIYFSVCDKGHGHSSRDMAIANTLSEMSANVLMGNYGHVLDRIRKDFNSVEVQRKSEMVGKEGEFDLKAKRVPDIILELSGRIQRYGAGT